MTYDPLRQQVLRDNNFNVPNITLGSRQPSNAVPGSAIPSPNIPATPLSPADLRSQGPGKFNIALNQPAPWVASAPKAPVQLGSQSMGPFETGLRGLESLVPGLIIGQNTDQILGNTLNGHINNFFGLMGSIPDTALRALPTIPFLPSGQNVQEAYSKMPDVEGFKAQYDAAMAADPTNASHYMAQYLRNFAQDYASSTGRNRLFSEADLPAESFADQASRVIFGALGAGNLAVRRTYVGSDVRDINSTVLNADPSTLPPDLKAMRDRYLNAQQTDPQSYTYSQFLDDLAVSRWAWTNRSDMVGGMATFAFDVLTDPVTLASFGLGAAASIAEKGAVMARAVNVGHALEAADPVAFEAVAAEARAAEAAGGAPTRTGIADLTQQRYPDVYRQGMSQLSGRDRALVHASPVIDAAARVVHKATNPLGWFGPAGDWAAEAMGSHFGTKMANGVANALGAGNLRRIASLAETSADEERVGRALGTYASNITNFVHQKSLTRAVRRSHGVIDEGVPNDIIAGRRLAPTLEGEAEDAARSVERQFIPRTRTGAAEVAASLAEGRKFATQAIMDLTGAGYDAATRMTSRASRKMLSTIHALNYGRVIDSFVSGKEAAIKDAEDRVRVSTGTADEVAATAHLKNAQRYTLVGDRELTTDRAKLVLDELTGPEPVAAARRAIEQFDALSHNFGDPLPDDVLVSEMKDYLKQVLEPGENGTRLVSTFSDRLPEPLRSFFEAEKARYGDNAYEVGLAPEDPWSVVYSQNGDVLGVHPWVDAVSDHGTPWLPSRMDRVRMGLFTHIRGNRLVIEARQRFVVDGITRGLTAGEAEALFSKIRQESFRRGIGPRGFDPIELDGLANEVGIKLTPKLRQNLGHHGIAWLTARAYEGELSAVGVTSKLSGQLKTKFARRGNMIGRIAEKLYPMTRFWLSPFFLSQEAVEPFFWNILRGHKPGVKWSERDVQSLRLLDYFNKHEDFNDQYEYLLFSRAVEGATMTKFGGGKWIGDQIAAAGSGGLAEIKKLNYLRQWSSRAAEQWSKSMDEIEPGFTDVLRAHYGTTDLQDVMLRYWNERGIGLSEDDIRVHVRAMDAMKPPDFADRSYVLLGDVAHSHDYSSAADLRSDVRTGRYTEAEFLDREQVLGHDPEYSKHAYSVAKRPGLNDFRDLLTRENELSGMSRQAAKASSVLETAFYRERAKALGIDPEDYIANHFTGGPTYLTHERLLPTGALLQAAKDNFEARGLTWHEHGTERFDRVINRARDLTGRPGAEHINDATKGLAKAQAWYDAYDEFRPLPKIAGLPKQWSEQNAQGGVFDNSLQNEMPYGRGYLIRDYYRSAARMLGHDGVQEASSWYRQMPSVFIGLTDALDDDSVRMFHERGLASLPGGASGNIGEYVPGPDLEAARDEMAARMLAVWSGTQMNTSPMAGMSMLLAKLDELRNGERTGWSGGGRAYKPFSLQTAQLEAVLRDFGPLNDKGLGQKLYDFVDSMVGNDSRTLLPDSGLQPAAIDLWVLRSLGFIDKTFVADMERRLINERSYSRTPMSQLSPDNQKYVRDTAHTDALQRFGITEEEFQALPKTVKATDDQYAWALIKLNKEAEWANAEQWMGRSDWTAADMQAIRWVHAQKVSGVDPGGPSNIFAQSDWDVNFDTLPGKGSLHSRMTDSDQLPIAYPPERQVWPRGIRIAPPQQQLVHRDMMTLTRGMLERELGIPVLSEMHGAGKLSGGVQSLSALSMVATDVQIEDALNAAGHYLQADNVFATRAVMSHDFPEKTIPDVSSPEKGRYWAVDVGAADPAATPMTEQHAEALVRYLNDKRSTTFLRPHAWVLARTPEGDWVARGLNLSKDALDATDAKSLLRVERNIERPLSNGTWVNAVQPGVLDEMPMRIQHRQVFVKRASNWDAQLESAGNDFASQHPAVQEIADKIDLLDKRLHAMREGHLDPTSRQSQGGVHQDLSATAHPGEDLPTDEFYWDDHIEPFRRMAKVPLNGTPNEIVIRRLDASYGFNENVMVVRSETGKGFVWGMTYTGDGPRIKSVHYTSLNPGMVAEGEGLGTKLYDRIADEHPELSMEGGIGASGSFSYTGGVFAYDWLQHRRDVLAGRLDKFNAWEWQNEQANAHAAGVTPYEQVNQGRLPERSFAVGDTEGRRRFLDSITRTRTEHPVGAAVEVKDPGFYLDPSNKLFLSDDGLAGAAVTSYGDLVSVFKHPGSNARIGDILREAAKSAKTLDAFDIKGYLPNLYAPHGFRPAARMKFNREYAPDGWDFNKHGEPDVVLMVRDPHGFSGMPEVHREFGGYDAVRDRVPVFEDYDQAIAAQKAAADAVAARERQGVSEDDIRARELGKPYLDHLRANGRPALAERMVDQHAPLAAHALDDSIRRHAPAAYSARRAAEQHGHVLRLNTDSGLGDANHGPLFQRSPSGVRGAVVWNARREATRYVLNADRTTGVHEAFHLFADELAPSSKSDIARAYATSINSRLNRRGNRSGMRSVPADPAWSTEIEDWAAERFVDWARDPNTVAPTSSMQANLHAFTKWGKDNGLADPATVDPVLADTFKSLLSRDLTPAAHFNIDEQRLWEASRVALLRMEDEAHKTHFYARGRNWVERSINHPYLGLYPFSYMWGKVVPEMLRFLTVRPFGLKAPLGGLLLAKQMWFDIQLQLQTDPGLQQYVKDHPQTIRFINMLVPGTPWETPVNAPLLVRRGIETYMANQQKVAQGQPASGFDLGGTLDDIATYSIGLTHLAGDVSQIGKELTGANQPPAANQPVANPFPVVGPRAATIP